MAKKFVRGLSSVFESKDKDLYKDSIVFLEDAKQIWTNGIYYGGKLLIQITYQELKDLRDSKQLIPGMQYCIMDYYATTSQNGTKTLPPEQQDLFGIIVVADDEMTLNCNARAVDIGYWSREFPYDYTKWELKYDIDNGYGSPSFIIRGWGDTDNGHGLIYYMKDEYGNECGFDFKNILIDTSYILDGDSEASMLFEESTIHSGYGDGNFTHLFAYPDMDQYIDYNLTNFPQMIRNVKISNYKDPDYQDLNSCMEFIPYVYFHNTNLDVYELCKLNLTIENSNKVFISCDDNLSGFLDNFSTTHDTINITIKDSTKVYLGDIYSPNVNITNCNDVYVGGGIYSGGFFGKELTINNSVNCIISNNILIDIHDEYSLFNQVIKINNCPTCCILDNIDYKNDFICENSNPYYMNDIATENYNIIVIKNTRDWVTEDLIPSEYLEEGDLESKEIVFTKIYDEVQEDYRTIGYCLNDLMYAIRS